MKRMVVFTISKFPAIHHFFKKRFSEKVKNIECFRTLQEARLGIMRDPTTQYLPKGIVRIALVDSDMNVNGVSATDYLHKDFPDISVYGVPDSLLAKAEAILLEDTESKKLEAKPKNPGAIALDTRRKQLMAHMKEVREREFKVATREALIDQRESVIEMYREMTKEEKNRLELIGKRMRMMNELLEQIFKFKAKTKDTRAARKSMVAEYRHHFEKVHKRKMRYSDAKEVIVLAKKQLKMDKPKEEGPETKAS